MLVREVRLDCGRETWVFARTLIPLRGIRGAVLGLTQLGHRPLGEVLFANPTTRRLRVEVARILPRHHLFARATAHLGRRPAALCGRRTLFEYGGCPILVNELFLPAMPPYVPWHGFWVAFTGVAEIAAGEFPGAVNLYRPA